MTKKLDVNMADLASALEDTSYEMKHYLDLKTGAIITIHEELFHELESIYDEFYDLDDDEAHDKLAMVLQERRLPEWRLQTLIEADRVERDFGDRYLAIPGDDVQTAYRDMVKFIGTIRNEVLQESLERAIQGRGAFRYFKDVLYDHPQERDRWFEFKNKQLQLRCLDWLASEGIELVNDPMTH